MANNLVVRCLINQGVLVEAIEQHGRWGASWARWSPVHSAAAFGQLTLLDYTLLVEPVGHRDGLSPVIVAARNGWPELIPPLVEHGFDAFKVDAGGVSALEVACRQRWSRSELRESFGDIGLRKCVKSGHLVMERPAAKFRYTGPGGGWGTNPSDEMHSWRANAGGGSSGGGDDRGGNNVGTDSKDGGIGSDGSEEADSDPVEVVVDEEAPVNADAEGKVGIEVDAYKTVAGNTNEIEIDGNDDDDDDDDDLFGVEIAEQEEQERQPLLRALWNGFQHGAGKTDPIATNGTDTENIHGAADDDELLVDPSSPAAVKSVCEFDVVEGLTDIEFHKKYVRLRLPVLVRGALKGPEWDDLRTKWSRDNIVKSNPDVRVNVSTIPCGVEFAVAEIQTSLQDHIAHMDSAEAVRGRRRGATRQQLFDAAIAAASAAAIARDNDRINVIEANEANEETAALAVAAAARATAAESNGASVLSKRDNAGSNPNAAISKTTVGAEDTNDLSAEPQPVSSFGAERGGASATDDAGTVEPSESTPGSVSGGQPEHPKADEPAATAAGISEELDEEERLQRRRKTAPADGGGEGSNIVAAVSIDADGGQRLPPPRYIYAPITDISPPNSSIMQTVLPLTPSFVDRKKIKRPASHFYLGSAGSGAPMHYHSHAYNVLVYGRKRWVVLPPRHALFSKQHIANWLETEYKALREDGAAMECIQEPGDVLYIPEGWAHGVLNLDDSIGFSVEFREWDGYGGTNTAAAAEQQKRAKKKNRKKHQHTHASGSEGDAAAASESPPSPERNHISLAQHNLMLEPTKVLEQILKTFYRDSCKGCTKKQEYVDRIIALGTQ